MSSFRKWNIIVSKFRVLLQDSEFGDDDIPFPLDAATFDQLMPKRGRPVGAKDTKQRRKRMGMCVISLARKYAADPSHVAPGESLFWVPGV